MTNGAGKPKAATLWQILGAGAAGGVLYTALCFYNGGLPGGQNPPLPYEQWRWVGPLVVIVLAAGAGVFGVWLANTNREDSFRCIVFAGICGFTWEPTLSAVSARATTQWKDSQVGKVLEQAAQAKAGLEGGAAPSKTTVSPGMLPAPDSGPRASSNLNSAATATVALLESLDQIQNTDLRAQAQKTALDLTSAAKLEAETHPEAAKPALSRIARAATATGQTQVLSVLNRDLIVRLAAADAKKD